MVAQRDEDLRVLREYAEFWKIPYSLAPASREDDVVVNSGPMREAETYGDASVIVSPSGREDFRRTAHQFNLQFSSREVCIRLPVAPGISASLTATVNQFQGPRLEPEMLLEGTPILSRVEGTQVHLLSLDLVSEYSNRVYGLLEEAPCLRFRLISKLPFSYRTIPPFLRNLSFRSPQGSPEMTEEKLGPVEGLRAIFLASLLAVSKYPIPLIGFWRRGKSYALAVTHDVETKRGLNVGTPQLLRMEGRLGVRSSWTLSSERYPLSAKVLGNLAQAGEICAHDTRHDGRLILLDLDGKVERLKRCRNSLEASSQTRVRGFRSPLLQHSRELVTAIGRAGYAFDSSVPSWEILSPTSLKPHGVGTVFPFYVNGVLEIPVSLPQDHQLLRVEGLKPPQAVERLLKLSRWIRGIGGPCVLLVHPDYEFGRPENEAEYQRLLETFLEDDECELMTLGEMSEWWTRRRSVSIDTSDGYVSIRSQGNTVPSDDFQLQIITGYGPEGFKVESLS